MAGYYTESNYENAVLQLLNEGLGYTYVYGPDVERDYHSPLYEDVLLPALQRINKGFASGCYQRGHLQTQEL